MDTAVVQRLAPPGVTALVAFLAGSSQWLFASIEPGPLRKGDAYFFNASVACLLICYWRTCYTDPGRIPQHWYETLEGADDDAADGQASQRQRWCRKCETFKPPRAHHCKTCQRCITRMDHHCVWTANCVSHVTFPHFVRFLIYAVLSMVYLQYFLYQRCAVLWQKRHMPSYLGPTVFQLVHLFFLVVTNSLVLFALTLLLGRTVWSMALNTTMIEGWEIERHHTLLRRARVLGGFLYGPDGTKVPIEHQEFPWDVGIWKNLCLAMDSRIPFLWLWPMAKSPSIESGLEFEHNGIDDPSKPWPPPDPDRLFRAPHRPQTGNGFTQSLDIDDFRRRQAADFGRYADADGDYVVRRRPFHERLERMQKDGDAWVYDEDETAIQTDSEQSGSEEEDERRGRARDDDGEEAWRNKEGERLADFGVDEVADFYDEDNLPLAEIIRRRKARM